MVRLVSFIVRLGFYTVRFGSYMVRFGVSTLKFSVSSSKTLEDRLKFEPSFEWSLIPLSSLLRYRTEDLEDIANILGLDRVLCKFIGSSLLDHGNVVLKLWNVIVKPIEDIN